MPGLVPGFLLRIGSIMDAAGFLRPRVIGALACLLVPAILYLAVPDLRRVLDNGLYLLTDVGNVESSVKQLRDYLLGFGILAPIVSALLMVIQAVIAPIPAFMITFTNGLLFGWLWGAALSWSSAMAGAALCFWLARTLARPAVEKLAGGTRGLAVFDLFFQRYGIHSILIARLLPFVPFDPISYGAGLTKMRFWPFFLATGIGQLPATLLYSWLGFSATGSVRFLFLMFSTVTAIAVIGWIAMPILKLRLRRPAQEEPRA